MDELNDIVNKRARYSEDFNSDDSNMQATMSPSSINSQLASFLVKSEVTNSIRDEDEGSPQEYQQSNHNHNFSFNVFQLLQKEANQLSDVDLHVLITRCKETPVIFRRNRDETYATLLFHTNGIEAEAEPTNYVECRICAKIFTRSGGHLKRHRTKHYPEIDQIPSNIGSNIGSNFEPPSISTPQLPPTPQSLPPVFPTIEMTKNSRHQQGSPNLIINNLEFNAIRPNEKENLARTLTQFCVQEGLTPGLIQRRPFIDLINVILSLGVARSQHQLVANMIIPPAELITTCIYRRFNWLCHEKIPQIQNNLLIYNGAFVVGCLPSNPKLTALSIHYFDQKWNLKKAVVGLAPMEPGDALLTWNQCLDSVTAVNLQRQTLNALICVSGIGTATWEGLITPENRNILCSCDLIEQIADDVFNQNTDFNDFNEDIDFVNKIVGASALIMKYAKFQTFNCAVKIPPDTVYKWLKTLRVIEFAKEEMGQLRAISNTPEINAPLPKEFFDALQILETNRDFLVNLTEFLKIFRVAILELQAIEEPTLHLVWPAVMTMKYDLKSFQEQTKFSQLKTLISHALQLIENNMPHLIKDEHRTATFLNPKQRKLQHLLSPDEYEQFKDNLRTRLLIEKPTVEPKVVDRRKLFYEDDDESEVTDELDRYLNAKRVGNETIVDFWRRNEVLMPKLSAEARRLLACSSSNYVCGNLSHYIGKTTEFSVEAIAKFIITRSLEHI